MTHNVFYQQIENGYIANQIHGFTIDYGKFILIPNMPMPNMSNLQKEEKRILPDTTSNLPHRQLWAVMWKRETLYRPMVRMYIL